MIPLSAKQRTSFWNWCLYQAVPIFLKTNFVSFVFIELLHKNHTDTRSNKRRFLSRSSLLRSTMENCYFSQLQSLLYLRAKMLQWFLRCFFFWRIEICFNFPYERSVLAICIFFWRGESENLRYVNTDFVFLFGAWICVFRVSWTDYVLQISRLLCIVNNLLCRLA